jgi:Tol biopolymer transport system component
MNKISHKQAMKLIHLRLDGMLKEKQSLLLLDEHLHSCESCHAYANELGSLPAYLNREFKNRWDSDRGPSVQLAERVSTKARKIPMQHRFAAGMKLVTGFAAVLIFGLLINLVISQMRDNAIVTNGTETSGDVAPVSMPAGSRLLAFTKEMNGNFDIYTIRADGTGLTNLTNSPEQEDNPYWSPDGKRIAFNRIINDQQQVFVMNADGSNVIQLTEEGAFNKLVSFEEGRESGFDAWSPDGKKLVFIKGNISQANDGKSFKLYVLDVETKTQTPLTTEWGLYRSPAWSPDGMHVAFTSITVNEQSTPDQRSVQVADADGNNLVDLTESLPSYLSPVLSYWSRDGQSIFFFAHGEGAKVYEARLDGSLIEHASGKGGKLLDWWNGIVLLQESIRPALTWLHDGTVSSLEICPNENQAKNISYSRSNMENLFFGIQCLPGEWRLYLTNKDGSIVQTLLDSPLHAGDGVMVDQVWSPDDNYVAFNISSQSGPVEMFILNVASALADPSTQSVKINVGDVFSFADSLSWQPIQTPELTDNPTELKIDPQSCKPSTLESVPGDLYGHDIVENTSFVDGDFSYEFWLYCDPSLKPDDEKNFSAIAGLGIYASWYYTGPNVEGENQYYFEFEPNVPLGRTGWNGPFYRASATGAQFGIGLSEATVRSYIQQGTPIQFSVIVDSPLGQNSATFSFHLEPTEKGLRIVDLQADQPDNSDEGLIAFTSEQSGNLDIYTMRPDGTDLTNLTNHPAHESNPIWSPDGKYLAFESNRNGFIQIYLMDADGSNVIQFTNDKADHSLPLNIDGKSNPWSPDGSKLLFLQSSSGREIWNLYVKEVNGENKVLLASGRFSLNSVSWSPNGKYIGYVLNDSPTPNETFVTGIYVVDSNGNNSQELKKLIPQNENLGSPYYWSSDGQSILFIADKNEGPGQTVYEFDLETNTLLQKDMLKQGVIDWQDEITLVSERSAFVWQRSDGTSNTLDWGDSNCLLDVTRSLHGNFAIGAYCPDSKKFKLYWANSDGSTIKQLLDSSTLIGQLWDIAWSPDDQYIAFNIISDKTSMYIVNVKGALQASSIQPTQMVIGSDELYTIPSWQPVP